MNWGKDAIQVMGQGYRFLEQQLYENAVQCFLDVIQQDQKYDDVHLFLGIAYKYIGQNQKAINSFLKAVEFDQKNTRAFNNLGLAYQNNNQNEKAIDCYMRVLEINETDTIALCNLGSVYRIQKQYEKSINSYLKAIEISKIYAEAQRDLGLVYYDQNQYAKAQNYFKIAADIRKNDILQLTILGFCFLKINKTQEAVGLFQKIKQLIKKWKKGDNSISKINERKIMITEFTIEFFENSYKFISELKLQNKANHEFLEAICEEWKNFNETLADFSKTAYELIHFEKNVNWRYYVQERMKSMVWTLSDYKNKN